MRKRGGSGGWNGVLDDSEKFIQNYAESFLVKNCKFLLAEEPHVLLSVIPAINVASVQVFATARDMYDYSCSRLHQSLGNDVLGPGWAGMNSGTE